MGRLSTSAAAFAVTALAIAGGGAYALASASSGTITVCVSHTSGTLYRAKKCAKHDTKLSWSTQGPRGLPGATGATGATGTQGPPGPATGPAGGDLAGSYPKPTIAAGAVTPSKVGTLPAARVTLGANETIPSGGAQTTLNWGAEDFATPGVHSTATNNSRLVAPIAGVYQINVGVRWSGTNSAAHYLGIVNKSGIRIASVAQDALTSGDLDQAVSTLYRLSAGDYVQAIVFNYDTVAATITTQEGISSFSMVWVAP